MIDVSVTTAICGTGMLWYEKGRFAHVAFELLTGSGAFGSIQGNWLWAISAGDWSLRWLELR